MEEVQRYYPDKARVVNIGNTEEGRPIKGVLRPVSPVGSELPSWDHSQHFQLGSPVSARRGGHGPNRGCVDERFIQIGTGVHRTDKRVIWIDGGIHAREWAAVHTVIYIIDRVSDL
ncbi:hypothetical protein COOONC_11313 [Cooperia oncophora]